MQYRVMIVDDSSTIRDMIEKIFRIARIPVREFIKCGNGREALDILDTAWVDLVVTDLYMPVMDGYSLIREIKSRSEFKAMPVVVVSTEGSVKRKDELKAMGVIDVLQKPFSPEQIRDTLVKSLGVEV
mgnify:CR=1 FL=1